MLTVGLTYPKVSLASVTDYVQCNLPSQSRVKFGMADKFFLCCFPSKGMLQTHLFFANCSAFELPE